MKKCVWMAVLISAAMQFPAAAQESSPEYTGEPLTIEDCRAMAVRSSNELDQARISVEMAGYDKKTAFANYFPNISVTGAYMYNNRDISLISDSQSEMLRNSGTLIQGQLNDAFSGAGQQINAAMADKMNQLMQAIQTNPALAADYMGSPMWQTVLNMLKSTDIGSAVAGMAPNIADPINAIGRDIDDALHPDMHNLWIGAVTVEQPVFVGGKIVYSNQIAALAEQLAEAKYDMKYADVIVDVDQAYWQIVSIANKKKLAESYSQLLHQMEEDVNASIRAGVATESDALQIKVKANEADMLLTKSTNGLVLAKMLLCKRIGLPLETEIVLADENLEIIPVPALSEEKSMDDIYADRPETRSLSLASQIYDKKALVARADLMPKVALTGSYTLTNPNLYNGFQNSWQGGMLSAGVMVNIPIFHGGESMSKYRKAQAEARLYTDQYNDARDLINLQVTQQRKIFDETMEKLVMCESNLESAEENLRKANVSFQAGILETNTVLAAHTAWLSAHSEYIDAGIELQMAAASLRKAEGNYKENE